MRYFDLPTALLLAAYASSATAAVSNGHRVLRAATRRSDLHKREMKISQKFESEVVYIEEENGWNGKETFASSVKVGSKKPIVNLEEIEHLLEDVECRDGKMMLSFVDQSSARDARAACHGGHGGMGGLIITSHPSCNREGERAVYKVDDVSFAKEGVALDLAVTESLWQDAFDNLDINFGHTRYDHIYRRHSNFLRARKKRQIDVAGLLSAATPSNATDLKFDLTSEVLDRTFTAADFLSGIESIANLPVVPDLPIEIGCKNCSTRGQIVLTQGAIKIDTKQVDLVPDIFDGGDDGKSITSVLKGGFMELAVKGLGARLEMFARPISSGSYVISLFPLPVLGFTIPGIGQAGASFEPKISVDFEITGEIAVNYGIDVTIPDGAGIKVELGDLAKTAITGIKGATLNALPFTTNVSDADIALSVAFTPTIPIGFEFSDKLSALVTVALDLPRLDARLTTNAQDQCSALDKTKKPKADEKPKGEEKPKRQDKDLSSLVLVEANISVVVGVSADLTLPLLPAPLDSAGTSTNIFSTEMPLMTSCVNPVKGALDITSMAPVATLTADKAEVTPAAGGNSTCTKHEQEKPCDCTGAIVTTTVYALPPTDAPFMPPATGTDGGYGGAPPATATDGGYGGSPPATGTDGGYGGSPPATATDGGYGGSPPPGETPPPLEMTPYYPDAPTAPANPPANPENPPAETPTGGYGQPPSNPENPPYPPTGGYGNGTGNGDGGYGSGAQPPATSVPCVKSSTIRITLSTPTAPPATDVGGAPPATETGVNTAPATDGGYGNGEPTPPAQPPTTETQTGGYGNGNGEPTPPAEPPKTDGQTGGYGNGNGEPTPPAQPPKTDTPQTQVTSGTQTATQTLATSVTSSHNFEDHQSKGFMGPPGTGTATGTGVTPPPSNSTGIIQFTGAAIPAYDVPVGWSGVGWQVAVLGAGLLAGGAFMI